MNTTQKVIRYCALALALVIVVSIISAALSLFGIISGIFGNGDGHVTENFTELDIDNTESIRSLKIEMDATNLEIVEGDGFKVETNNKNVKSSVNNGVLKVYERIRGRVKINTTVKAGVTLTVPKGFEFDKITVSSGAGKIYIEKLSAKELSFDLGAGKVTVDEISVSDSATIEGGAGDFDVNSGSIKDLDFDIGVGNTEVTLTLSGDCELNMGIGNLELTLAGDKDGYTIDVNKGLGRVSIDGENMNDGDVYGNGNTDIEIDGGIGNIEVNFK
jgi:hypothetical protein